MDGRYRPVKRRVPVDQDRQRSARQGQPSRQGKRPRNGQQTAPARNAQGTVRKGQAATRNAQGANGRRVRETPRPAPKNKAAQQRAREKAAQQKATRRRRVLIFLAMIAGIVLLAAAALYMLNGRGSSAGPVKQDPVKEWAPVACDPSMLNAELDIPGSSSVGSEIPLKVNLHNTSDVKPCYVDVGWSNVDVTVTSGSDEIVSSQACEMGAENKRLLLDRDMETSFSLSWPGGRGCGGGDPAQSGTYKATLTFDDEASDKETATFTLD